MAMFDVGQGGDDGVVVAGRHTKFVAVSFGAQQVERTDTDQLASLVERHVSFGDKSAAI